MHFEPRTSLGFQTTVQAGWLQQVVGNVLQNPLLGTTILHFQAFLAGPENFNEQGKPDYLAPGAGLYGSGVRYTPNPKNPLRGVFCRKPLRPFQENAGIHYQAECEIYLPEDPGEVFILDDKYPKRQDRFEVAGGVYYATAPVFPCQIGDTVAAWQVSLSRERFPSRTDNGL